MASTLAATNAAAKNSDIGDEEARFYLSGERGSDGSPTGLGDFCAPLNLPSSLLI